MALDLSTLRRPANPQVVDPSTGRMREDWQLYFDQLTTRINASVGALSTDPAPADAQYIVAATNGTLSAERVATNTATVEWDFATVGQAKASVPADAFGDVVGPASATDNAVPLFDGTTGKLLQNSEITVDANGNVTIEGDNQVLTLVGPANVGIELGNVDGTGGLTFVDFHTGATAVDYDVRLLASGGTGSDGGGTLNIAAGALQHNGVDVLTSDPSPLILATEQSTASGTAFDFASPIADPKRVTVMFNEVSLSASDDLLVQIGDSGGLETTGYVSTSDIGGSETTSTTGFVIFTGAATRLVSGHMILTKCNSSGLWVSSHSVKQLTNATGGGGGSKTLSATLDRVRLTRSGTNNFDGGSVNVLWE